MDKMSAYDIKQEKALQAIYESNTLTEAAKKAGISRKTLYKYLNYDDGFVCELRDLRREQFRELNDRITDGATAATDFIINLINNESASDSVRLNAAYKLLDLYGKYRDIETQLNKQVIYINDRRDENGFIESAM